MPTKTRPLSFSKAAIHQWLNSRYPRSGVCEDCGSAGNTQYASVNGHQYTRDRADYRELCRDCHLRLDRRGEPIPGPTAIVSAAIPPEMRTELERRAEENDRSLSSEIRRGLRAYLAAEKEEAA